jgi:hypothetical protein
VTTIESFVLFFPGRRSRPSSATADIDVLSQLTSLRRQLKNEEIKVQQQLSENKV